MFHEFKPSNRCKKNKKKEKKSEQSDDIEGNGPFDGNYKLPMVQSGLSAKMSTVSILTSYVRG